MSFDNTIKLVNKQRDVLVDVILNHSDKLNEGSDMELTKIKLK